MTEEEFYEKIKYHQIEIQKAYREFISFEGFEPPPWNINLENPSKLEGWIERQRWERKNKTNGT